jgi:hypothetical protein
VTKELLDDEFVLEPRGTIPVKGKGAIEAWYLLAGPSAETSVPFRASRSS